MDVGTECENRLCTSLTLLRCVVAICLSALVEGREVQSQLEVGAWWATGGPLEGHQTSSE